MLCVYVWVEANVIRAGPADPGGGYSVNGKVLLKVVAESVNSKGLAKGTFSFGPDHKGYIRSPKGTVPFSRGLARAQLNALLLSTIVRCSGVLAQLRVFHAGTGCYHPP